MTVRLPLCMAWLAALATGADAGTRTASIGVSATVIPSCRVEIPAHVPIRAPIPAARLTCASASRPAVRSVIATDADFRWVRYDVEY